MASALRESIVVCDDGDSEPRELEPEREPHAHIPVAVVSGAAAVAAALRGAGPAGLAEAANEAFVSCSALPVDVIGLITSFLPGTSCEIDREQLRGMRLFQLEEYPDLCVVQATGVGTDHRHAFCAATVQLGQLVEYSFQVVSHRSGNMIMSTAVMPLPVMQQRLGDGRNPMVGYGASDWGFWIARHGRFNPADRGGTHTTRPPESWGEEIGLSFGEAPSGGFDETAGRDVTDLIFHVVFDFSDPDSSAFCAVATPRSEVLAKGLHAAPSHGILRERAEEAEAEGQLGSTRATRFRPGLSVFNPTTSCQLISISVLESPEEIKHPQCRKMMLARPSSQHAAPGTMHQPAAVVESTSSGSAWTK